MNKIYDGIRASINISSEVLDVMRDYVYAKHGQIRVYLKKHVERAILEYLDNHKDEVNEYFKSRISDFVKKNSDKEI
jgi:hypothetical protein